MRRRLTMIVVLAVSALDPPLHAGKKEAPPVRKPASLVWPLPPEKPKVRYVATLANNTFAGLRSR